MIKVLSIVLIVFLILHGLIHLMGFIAYWPLGKISALPYKTSLLSGRWEVGAGGMRIFSLLWLLAALGFVAAALGLAFGRTWWAPLLLGATLLSLLLCILDWSAAFRGAWIDIALLVVLFVVFGLRVQPAPFPPFAASAEKIETVPLPAGLPAPVERYYRQTYGDQIPVYHSAVMSGRGTIRFMGITFPARLRFSHLSGKDYRHYMEATFYGIPLLKVNESYVDGNTRLELPFGVVENEPGVDSAANQGLWAESTAYPALFLTQPGVRWEALDDTCATLHVPFKDSEQQFKVTFDPESGALTRFETDRYRDAKVGTLHWWGEISARDGKPYFSVTWEDEGTPWLNYALEETAFNANLSEYIRQSGP